MKSIDPSVFTCGLEPRSPECIAYVFQGGGALGSFQVGVIEALQEYDYCPDIVSGVSIGAINAAIMAGNPRGQRLEKLADFWDKIATTSPFDILKTNNCFNSLYNYLGASSSLLFGQPGFFTPRLISPLFTPSAPVEELSFYDLSPLRETLLELIDFDLINKKTVGLYLGTVCLESGNLMYFSNDTDIITPEHIMASSALPPGFSAIKIKDSYFWDGAIYSNTPLTAVLDAEPQKNILCFAVNCFTAGGELPTTLDEIQQREQAIRYSSRLKEYLDLYSERQNFRCAIAHLSEKIPDNEKNDPQIQKLMALGSPKLVQVVQLNYKTTPTDHASKDYNFGKRALEDHRSNGYKTAIKALKRKTWEEPLDSYIGAVIYEESNNSQSEETQDETKR